MNPYELAENVFHPDYAAMSSSEQIRITSERLDQKGLNGIKEKHAKIIAEQQELEKASMIDMLSKMLTKDQVTDDDAYGDGDQSALKGNDSQMLRNQWASGMDFHPNNLSYFYKACYVSDFDAVKKTVEKASDDKVQLMEKRETMMRFNALTCVVQGARQISGNQKDVKQFIKVLRYLIEEGANIHAKDVAGYSVLFHCLTANGNIVATLKLAQILIDAGADSNTQNRFGCTPLTENLMIRRYEVLTFLIEHGADPSIADNDGISPNSMATLLPKGQNLFSKAGFLIGNKKRQEAKDTGNLGKCYFCNEKNAKKRCGRCLVAYYCNRNCQVKHWQKHKKDCSKKEKGKVDVQLSGVPSGSVSATINWKDLNVTVGNTDDSPKKTPFKVKVQIPIGFRNQKDPLLVYDKKRSFQKMIDASDPNYDKIVRKIKTDGVMKLKGYFYASMTVDGNLSLQVDHMLSPESW